MNRALRVERILIQSPVVEDDDGALNRRILLSTLRLQEKLEAASLSESCLRKPNGKCLVLSPLLFWNHDAETLMSDPNILDTLSLQNVTVSGVPVTPAMVLAGRGSSEHVAASKFDFAMFLALTYFFPQSDCIGDLEHSGWLQVVQQAAGSHAALSFQDKEPDLIALEVWILLNIIHPSSPGILSITLTCPNVMGGPPSRSSCTWLISAFLPMLPGPCGTWTRSIHALVSLSQPWWRSLLVRSQVLAFVLSSGSK